MMIDGGRMKLQQAGVPILGGGKPKKRATTGGHDHVAVDGAVRSG